MATIDAGLVLPALGAAGAGVALLVLPGLAVVGAARASLRLSRRRRGHPTPPSTLGVADTLVVATALSLCLAVVTGVVLIGLQALSPERLGVVTAVLALAGLVPLALLLRRAALRHAAQAGFVALASTPILISVLHGGYKPAHSYQWFYWGVGGQLSTVGGVPEHVLEWGREVRWQPDYLDFNLLTQTFLGLTPWLEDASAVALWRVPTTALLVATFFLVLRLWFAALPAAAGTAALTATTFFVHTVGNNAPESVGLAFGLIAVRLAVVGLREHRSGLLVLSAVTLGLDVSVHGVAATVCGLLLVAAVCVELLAARAGGAPLLRRLPVLGLAAVSGLVVLVAQGLAVQGRPSPLGDAANPGMSEGGSDPTYDFTRFSNGRFDGPIPESRVARSLLEPWPGFPDSWRWGWLVSLVLLGVVLAVVRRRSLGARAVLVAAGWAALVTAAVLYFELRYDTYVPKHTGNARIAAYFPVVYCVLVAQGAQALSGLASRIGRSEGRRASFALLLPAVVVVLLLAVSAPSTMRTMAGRAAISPAGEAALEWMREELPSGSRVVSNVATRGSLEFFTGVENPYEGRQPLIEDPRFLEAAVEELRDLHDYLQDPAPGALEDLNADYLVLSKPSHLGTGLAYGAVARDFVRRSGLKVLYREDGIRVLGTGRPPVPVESVGPARPLGAGILAALAAVAALLGLLVMPIRRLDGAAASNVVQSTAATVVR